MSLSETYLAQLHTLHTGVVGTFDRLNRMQSEMDREVSAIYHEIEKMELDEASALGAARLLQGALRKRRVVKDEIVRLQPIYQMLTTNVDETDKQYRKRVTKSDEIRRSLNVTLKIEDIGGFMYEEVHA